MPQLDRSSPIPLYHQIEHALLDLIRQRRLGRGDLFPSEHELVGVFGVSRLTVRNAVDRLVERGVLTRQRGRGTFVADPNIATGSSQIGLLLFVFARTAGLLNSRILAGAQREASGHGFQLAVAYAGDDPELEAREVASVNATGAAGLLLWPMGGKTDRTKLQRLLASGVPCVLVDRFLDDLETDTVVVDDVGGAYQVTAHLAALGHRRIGLVLYDDVDVSSVRLRRDGYRQALTDHGIAFDAELVVHHPQLPLDPTNLGLVEFLARQLLDQPSPPTAAFCVNDNVAQALLIVLQRQGVRVPDQFSIAGFDGVEYLVTHQRLTTARRSPEEMGREAVRLVVGRLRGEITGPAQHVLLPTELVIGESTAPEPTLVSATNTAAEGR